MTDGDGTDIQEIGIDIANFSELRKEGYVYVDKTDFVHKLLVGPRKRIFLSRPRRFGKTLLVDTLEEAAVGRKELFSGLAIDRLRKDGEWPRSHVLRIGMSGFGDEPALLDRSLTELLHSFATKRGFSITAQDAANSLRQAIEFLSEHYDEIPIITRKVRMNDGLVADRMKIVVLIDEYDAPIINNFADPDELAIATRTLHGFYNAMKSCDDIIERVFITGITKFSQLSVFSAMNNLRDITFKSEYATICGFTIDEISKYYSPHLDSALVKFQE
ncbi:MAG: AAA family ATPase, partial [Deltaproteobacteria bacterium]|nr:AAA family ATPase [Deltaproteobacteria bacterium]